MKTLRLTIMTSPNTSRADLANTFGEFEEIQMPVNRYLQFEFPSVRMLNAMQLLGIYNLLLSYEQEHGSLEFKMFHLYDDNDHTHSPISLQAYKGKWTIVNSSTGGEMNSAVNLLTLI